MSTTLDGIDEPRHKDIPLEKRQQMARDQDFIAAARTAVPALLAEVARLREALKRTKGPSPSMDEALNSGDGSYKP